MAKPKRSLPHPQDVALGARIRMCRLAADIHQETLATECGVTFQQIQKYEHGVNRISYSRLCEICDALGMTVCEVVAPLDSPRGKKANGNAGLIEMLADPDVMRLLLWMKRCRDVKMKKALLGLLELIE